MYIMSASIRRGMEIICSISLDVARALITVFEAVGINGYD